MPLTNISGIVGEISQIITQRVGPESKEVSNYFGREGSIKIMTNEVETVSNSKGLIINKKSLDDVLKDANLMHVIITKYKGVFIVDRAEVSLGSMTDDQEEEFEEEKEQSCLISLALRLSYSLGYQQAKESSNSDKKQAITKLVHTGKTAYQKKLYDHYINKVKPVYDQVISLNPKASNYSIAKSFMENHVETPNGSDKWEENSVKRFKESIGIVEKKSKKTAVNKPVFS